MTQSIEDEEFSGLSLQDQVPARWEAASLDDPLAIERQHQETARALQALALFEEQPRELTADPNAGNPELARLEAKVEVLLSLLSRMISDAQGLPPAHSVILRAASLEWSGPECRHSRPGDTGIVVLYPNPVWPLPLRLPARIVGQSERAGSQWQLLRLEKLAPAVQVGLEKLVFRRHRRQVALARGTGVFSQTGVFTAPKN